VVDRTLKLQGCKSVRSFLRRPRLLILTPGNVADITVAPILLSRAEAARYVMADKGYDFRDLLRPR
jgi:IS5 family transposase